MLSLLTLSTPTSAVKQNSETTEKQLSTLIIRGKSLKQTRKFLDSICHVERYKVVVNNNNPIGTY
jgi:hypothetical protein